LNIENLGQSKSNQEIILIANIVRDYDIIVIQEVVVDMWRTSCGPISG
jgi:hypothetical protein